MQNDTTKDENYLASRLWALGMSAGDARKAVKEATVNQQTTIADVRKWVDQHLAKPSILPVPVTKLTKREHDIFRLLAADRGFLKFLQTKLHNDE